MKTPIKIYSLSYVAKNPTQRFEPYTKDWEELAEGLSRFISKQSRPIFLNEHTMVISEKDQHYVTEANITYREKFNGPLESFLKQSHTLKSLSEQGFHLDKDELLRITRKRSKALGLTLIENLAVLAVIGILAFVMLPNFMSARSKGQITAAVNFKDEVRLVVSSFKNRQLHTTPQAFESLQGKLGQGSTPPDGSLSSTLLSCEQQVVLSERLVIPKAPDFVGCSIEENLEVVVWVKGHNQSYR